MIGSLYSAVGLACQMQKATPSQAPEIRRKRSFSPQPGWRHARASARATAHRLKQPVCLQLNMLAITISARPGCVWTRSKQKALAPRETSQRWPASLVRPMVNSLKTRVHALEIVLDKIYCYVTFFVEGSQIGPNLAIYSLFGWLIRWAGCWSARQVADLADPVLPATLACGIVLPAS